MFCPKCQGIQTVIKVHEEKDISQPRLCDVQCMECEYIVYYQGYDYGNLLNLVPVKDNEK